MRCVRRGTPAARSSAHRPLQDEGPYAASQFPKRVVGSVFWRDAQAGVPSAERPRAQLAFKTRWFAGFCNSHQVSHFATFFIDARAEISVAESRVD